MAEFKDKSEKDLTDALAVKRRALREFRFSISGSKTRNVREGRNLRREIAQIMTELNARAKH